MKLSPYHYRALLDHYADEAALLKQNRSFVSRQRKGSRHVDWRGYRRRVAVVGALRKIIKHVKP